MLITEKSHVGLINVNTFQVSFQLTNGTHVEAPSRLQFSNWIYGRAYSEARYTTGRSHVIFFFLFGLEWGMR
jgi:hypothetical protein